MPLVFALAFVIGFLIWASAAPTPRTSRCSGLLAGSLRAGHPAGLRRARRRALRARRRREHRDRGPAAARAPSRPPSSARSPDRRRRRDLRRGRRRAGVGMVLARLRDQVPGRPGHRRRGAQRAGRRPHRFLFSRCWPRTPTTLQLARRALEAMRDPVPGDIPIIGPVLLQPDAPRLPHVRRRGRGLVRALQDPLGPARARRRRAPEGRGHRRHQGQPRCAFRNVLLARRDRRPRRRVLHAGLGRQLQQGDDGRRRLHRPGRGDLRPLEPDRGDLCGAAVRLRHRTCSTC